MGEIWTDLRELIGYSHFRGGGKGLLLADRCKIFMNMNKDGLVLVSNFDVICRLEKMDALLLADWIKENFNEK